MIALWDDVFEHDEFKSRRRMRKLRLILAAALLFTACGRTTRKIDDVEVGESNTFDPPR